MGEIISRKEAKEKGLTKYFTGKPCKHGHVCHRWTSGGACAECLKQIQKRPNHKDLCKKWRQNNLDRNREIIAKWKKENRDLLNFYESIRRSTRRNACPKWLTEEQKKKMSDIYKKAKEMSVIESYHVDHIIPLTNDSVCGLHVPWNLQIIPAEDNLKKGNYFG